MLQSEDLGRTISFIANMPPQRAGNFGSVSREIAPGDRFRSDCIRHHPVSRNPQLIARKQKSRFCGHFSGVVVSDFRSLRGDIVSRSLFGASVSGGKNPVPNSVRASAVIGLQVRPYWSSRIRAPSPKNVTPPIQMASIAVSNAEPTSASRLKDTRMKTRRRDRI